MSVHRQQVPVRANLPSFECPPCPVTSGVLMADHRCPRLILADGPSTHLSSMETSGVQSRVRGISLVGGMLSAHLYPPGLRVRCNRPGLRQDYRPLESVSNRLTLRVSDVRPLRSFHGRGLPDPRGRSDLRQVAVRGALLGSAARSPKLPASVSQPANQAHKGRPPPWSNIVSSPPARERLLHAGLNECAD